MADKMTLPITVVIPNYKQEQWLEYAIKSALEAGASEILNYPDNNTYRAGVCYARNWMIEHTKNDLILPLDADDRLYPDALQRMYDAWKPGTFVYGRYMEIDEDENDIREMDCPPPQLIFRKNLTYSTFLFSRDDWERVGGYDVDFEFGDEDMGFQCALVNAGITPIRLEGAPLYKRMLHEISRSSKARPYWDVTMRMCREKYPAVFAGH